MFSTDKMILINLFNVRKLSHPTQSSKSNAIFQKRKNSTKLENTLNSVFTYVKKKKKATVISLIFKGNEHTRDV